MRLRLLCLAMAVLCLAFGTQAACAVADTLPETVEMYYFYENLCASCNATEIFDAAAEEAMAGVRDQYPYVIHRYNIYKSADKAIYQQVCRDMGLDADALSLPVFIAGGRVFQGDETIAKNLREAYLVAGEDLFVNHQVYNPAQKKTGAALFDDYAADADAITVVYFYRITCEECAQTTPIIDALPETVAVEGEPVPVEVIRINTRSGNNGDRVSAFFDAYSVPDEDRMVPIAFTEGQYFAGIDAIASGLADALATTPPGFAFPSGE